MADKTVSVVLGARDKMSSALKNASKSTFNLSKEVGTLKGSMKGLAKGTAAVGALAVGVALLAARGEDLRTMESSFNNLAAQAELSGSAMLTSMQTASDGLIRNFDLIKNSNKLLAAGITPSIDQMAELANASKRLGIGLGLKGGAAEAMNALSTAVATGRTTSLAAMGVIVDSTAEIEKWSAANGRVAESVTEAEKKSILFKATLEETSRVIEKMGEFSVGLGGQIDQLKVALQNSADESAKFASAFGDSMLLAFGQAVSGTESFSKALEFNAERMTEFSKIALVTVIDGFVFLTQTVNVFLNVLNILQVALGAIATAFVQVGKVIFQSLVAPIEAAILGASTLAKALGQDELVKSLDGVLTTLDSVKAGFNDAADATTEWAMQGLADIEANDAALLSMTDQAGKFRQSIEMIDSSTIVAGMEGAADASGVMANNLTVAAGAANDAAAGIKAAEDAAKAAVLAQQKQEADAFKAAMAADKAAAKALTDAQAVENAATIGIAGALASGDAKASLAQLFEGVSIAGFDIGAILGVITSLNKELPSLLFQSLKDLLVNVVQELPLLIGNIIPDLIIPIIKLIPEIINGFIDNLPIMVEAIIKSIPELVVALVETIWSLGIPLALRMLNTIAEMWLGQGYIRIRDQAIRDVTNMANEFLDQVVAAFPAAWSSIGDEINSWWQRTIWSDLTEKLGQVLSEASTMFMESIIQPYIDLHIDAAMKFVEVMTSFWDSTFGAFPDMIDAALDRMNEPFDRIVDHLNDIADKLGVGGPGGTTGAVLDTISKGITDVTGISFASGTEFVPRTGMFQLHKGEQVVPAGQSAGNQISLSMPVSFFLEVKAGTIDDARKIGQMVVKQIVDNVDGAQVKVRNALAGKGI